MVALTEMSVGSKLSVPTLGTATWLPGAGFDSHEAVKMMLR